MGLWIKKEDLLEKIRRMVEESGGKRLGRKRFLEVTGWSRWDLNQYFPNWNDALKAAGFDFDRFGERPEAERLLEDWGAVTRRLGRVPQFTAYDIHGAYSGATVRKRFGTWNNVGRAFEAFAAGKEEWKDVMALWAESLGPGGVQYKNRARPTKRARVLRKRAKVRAEAGEQRRRDEGGGRKGLQDDKFLVDKRRRVPATVRRLADRPTYGAPLDFPGMRSAPTNEAGVVLLFGMLAERMGFYVEAARATFPDCEARRRLDSGEYQTVRIEFEYESRNFFTHGHAAEGCDIIVCWRHNWEECPHSLEVIELREYVGRLCGNDEARMTNDERMTKPE